MEMLNGDFTQRDYNNLVIELGELQKQQWLEGVDNSARIKEIEEFLDSFSGDQDDYDEQDDENEE